MATGDKQNKHCQTICFSEIPVKGMYDETVEVNAREIESPSSDEEAVKAAMAKFNPPVRHTAKHDFDSESECDSAPEKFDNISEEDEVCILFDIFFHKVVYFLTLNRLGYLNVVIWNDIIYVAFILINIYVISEWHRCNAVILCLNLSLTISIYLTIDVIWNWMEYRYKNNTNAP